MVIWPAVLPRIFKIPLKSLKRVENITLNAKPKVFDWISNFPKKYHEKVDKQIGSSDEFPPFKVNRNKSTDWLEPTNVSSK